MRRTSRSRDVGRALTREATARGWDVSYLIFQRRRYEVLTHWCEALLDERTRARVLVVGPGYELEYLRRLHPQWQVDSLGFYDVRFPERAAERHLQVDLRDVTVPERLPQPDASYDLVIAAEVIEHLPVALNLVLRYLSQWMTDRGRMIIQTPNAVSLPNRLRMLAGRNPFELIREETESAGHFREYTASELIAIGQAEGLETLELRVANYFKRVDPPLAKRLYFLVSDRLPSRLRAGITVVFHRRTSVPDAP